MGMSISPLSETPSGPSVSWTSGRVIDALEKLGLEVDTSQPMFYLAADVLDKTRKHGRMLNFDDGEKIAEIARFAITRHGADAQIVAA